jgi:hypothetical protein
VLPYTPGYTNFEKKFNEFKQYSLKNSKTYNPRIDSNPTDVFNTIPIENAIPIGLRIGPFNFCVKGLLYFNKLWSNPPLSVDNTLVSGFRTIHLDFSTIFTNPYCYYIVHHLAPRVATVSSVQHYIDLKWYNSHNLIYSRNTQTIFIRIHFTSFIRKRYGIFR